MIITMLTMVLLLMIITMLTMLLFLMMIYLLTMVLLLMIITMLTMLLLSMIITMLTMLLLLMMIREMEDWLVKAEGTWVLAEGFNNFLGKVMHDEVCTTAKQYCFNGRPVCQYSADNILFELCC